jgi:AcrB/AcrD/AcrF family/DDE domain
MMTNISYSGYRFPPEIIQQAIWLYVRFTLSFRDVEDLLAERGIVVSYETVRRWVNHFGPKIAADLRKRRPKPHTTWHLDEVYLKIDGRLVYLWRAVDAEGEGDLLIHSSIAAIGIVLLLSIVTRNWRNLLLVLINLPFALVGGVLAVFATGGVLSLGSMVGFVTLFGITLRNSSMIISHYEYLVEAEGMRWGLEAAIKGAGGRLTPILMTSLVTALGLLPLAIGMGEPGREIEGPMALVILGGLMTSMALNLHVLPTLAFRFGRFEPAIDELAGKFPYDTAL